jgi:hypothetical protein
LNKELQWPTMEIVSHNFSQRTDFPLGVTYGSTAVLYGDGAQP